jgi:hypothetical protein
MVRIGLWGTYGIEDLGLALSPRIVRAEMTRRLPGSVVSLWSVGGPGRDRFEEPEGEPHQALGTWSEGRLEELAAALDVLVIDRPSVRSPGVTVDEGYRFFIGGLGSAHTSVPIAWHLADVPGDLGGVYADEVRDALVRCAYVSVRDERSRERLRVLGVEREIVVVPEPAILVDRLFRVDQLEERTTGLREVGALPEDDVLVVQGSAALLPNVDAVAEQVDRLCRDRSLVPVVVQTSDVDDDEVFASALAERLPEARRLALDAGPEVLCAVLAWSAGFVGNSVPALFVSAAFDRPGVLLEPAGPAGLDTAEAFAAPEGVVDDPSTIAEVFERVWRRGPDVERTAELRARVDAHLDRLAGLVTAGGEDGALAAGASTGAVLTGREPDGSADTRALLARLAAQEAASAQRERELQELIDSLTRQITEVDVRFTKLWRKIRECDKHYEWQFNRAERAEARLGNVDQEIAAVHAILQERDQTIAEFGRHLMPWYRARRRLRRWRAERATRAADATSVDQGS